MDNFYCGTQCVALHLLVSKQNVNEQQVVTISQFIKSVHLLIPQKATILDF